MDDGSVICLPDQTRPAHSPLGASSCERWSNCPGSNRLLTTLELPETDDPDYRREGSAMHEAAEFCLNNWTDTWEVVGKTFVGITIDVPMANAVQMYLNECRAIMAEAQAWMIEEHVDSDIHPLFYGTMDFAAVYGVSNLTGQPFTGKTGPWPLGFIKPTRIKCLDLKGGEGIIVEPDTPQLRYYVYGIVDKHPEWADETPVDLGICQPRAFHHDGPVRWLETTVGEIRAWARDFLVPAMQRAETDTALDPGKWCRFCPAKLVCPMLTSLFRAAATCNPAEIPHYDTDSIGRSYVLLPAVKHYIKALEDDAFRRLQHGETMEGYAKLVAKKSNRVWNPGAHELAKARFGDEAVVPVEIKSPAELEKLGKAAKDFVKEFAHHPSTGFTVAPWEDNRTGIKVQTAGEVFGAALANLTEKSDAAAS